MTVGRGSHVTVFIKDKSTITDSSRTSVRRVRLTLVVSPYAGCSGFSRDDNNEMPGERSLSES